MSAVLVWKILRSEKGSDRFPALEPEANERKLAVGWLLLFGPLL